MLTVSDGYGRVTSQAPSGPQTAYNVTAPATGLGATLYSRTGDVFGWTMLALAGVLIGWTIWARRRAGSVRSRDPPDAIEGPVHRGAAHRVAGAGEGERGGARAEASEEGERAERGDDEHRLPGLHADVEGRERGGDLPIGQARVSFSSSAVRSRTVR